MSKEAKIRILIADDHPIVREGLTAIVESQKDMTVVAEAVNGHKAVEFFQQYQPDITLMDLRMPEMDGVTAIQAIRAEALHARIIVLTTYNGDEDIYRALKAGAKAYLLKTTPREELLETIRAVHEGQTRIPSEVASQLTERLGNPELTVREMEVLHLIAAGKSNQEIGHALSITEGTVKAHVNSLLGKLNVNDRTQAALTAIKRGLVHLP